MRPPAKVIGIAPGICLPISVSLALVLIVFPLLAVDQSRLRHAPRP